MVSWVQRRRKQPWEGRLVMGWSKSKGARVILAGKHILGFSYEHLSLSRINGRPFLLEWNSRTLTICAAVYFRSVFRVPPVLSFMVWTKSREAKKSLQYVVGWTWSIESLTSHYPPGEFSSCKKFRSTSHHRGGTVLLIDADTKDAWDKVKTSRGQQLLGLIGRKSSSTIPRLRIKIWKAFKITVEGQQERISIHTDCSTLANLFQY